MGRPVKAHEIIGCILLALAAFASLRAVRTLRSGEYDYAGGDPCSGEEKRVARRRSEPAVFWACWIIHLLLVVLFAVFGLRYLGRL